MPAAVLVTFFCVLCACRWEEVLPSLRNMVQAAALVRAELAAAAGGDASAQAAPVPGAAAQQNGKRGGPCDCCTASEA